MADTTFTDYTTPVVAAWLNDVNISTYRGIGPGSVPGASISTFLSAGTGARTRTVQDKLRDWINVYDFTGVDPTGVTDSTSGINAALAAGLRIDFGGADKSYKVSGALSLRTGHNIRGDGATITQITSNTEIFNYEGKSNIEIAGIKFVGKSTDYANSDSSRAVAIFGSAGESNIDVHHCTFTGFSYTTLRAKGATNVQFWRNTIVGPGHPNIPVDPTHITDGRCYGVLIDSGCSDVVIERNRISLTAQGIRVELSADVRIAFNKIFGTAGQHGIYAGAGLTNVQIVFNKINDTELVGIKVQNADYGAADTVGLIVLGNIVVNAGDQGILIYSSDSAPTYKLRDVICSKNIVKSPATNGINVSSIYGGKITDNICRSATQSGISYSECDDLTISGNKIKNSVLSGIRDLVVSTRVEISGNSIIDCASGATVNDRYGILVSSAASYLIDANKISDANAAMEYGLFIIAGTMTGVTVRDNIVTNATGTGARFPASSIFQYYGGNIFAGTGGPTTNDPIQSTVASAAALTLPQGQDVVTVSGTTTITSIPVGGHAGRRVTLIFSGALTFTDGSNLALAGNFVTTANDTITIACDGNNWFEVARSVN